MWVPCRLERQLRRSRQHLLVLHQLIGDSKGRSPRWVTRLLRNVDVHPRAVSKRAQECVQRSRRTREGSVSLDCAECGAGRGVSRSEFLPAQGAGQRAESALKASPPPPCRFSTRRSASHGRERSCAPSRPRDAALCRLHVRTPCHPPRRVSSSRSPLQEPRHVSRIVVHRPRVGESAVDALELLHAPVEAPQHVRPSHVVAALPDARRDPPQRQVGPAITMQRGRPRLTRAASHDYVIPDGRVAGLGDDERGAARHDRSAGTSGGVNHTRRSSSVSAML
jgi:hypothetical protein